MYIAIPRTAPSREDIMYQGPGGCIVGKYNDITIFSDCLECLGVCQAADNCDVQC